ncbi:hypothetical protein [Parerythrobacter aestuarii]|uniref:hypothetical protein n=1 Tax=Parerythrobacter aestuarii TaxID=3020909 RepID=UPI0024DE8793|nr:hypothetical protein [Parerythrobacter aestuarii]
MILLIYFLSEQDAFWRMRPNEFGDFLAGSAAPLAFLWLVLGFLQQGIELRNSSKALHIQGEELRNSVEQQRALVEVARDQLKSELDDRRAKELEAERLAQPRFLTVGGASYSGQTTKQKFHFRNVAATCTDVSIVVDGQVTSKAAHLPAGETISMQRSYDDLSKMEDFRATIYFKDELGKNGSQEFEIELDPSGGPNQRPTYREARRVDAEE